MSLRTKLQAFFLLTALATLALFAWGVSLETRRAFEQFDRQRSEAVVAQFRREYDQRAADVTHRVQSIADAEATLRMAMELNRPQADPSQYYNDARALALAQQLDFLDIIADDGSLISSAEWPSRFGYKNEWVLSGQDWNAQDAFLQRVELPDGTEMGLLAVRVVRVGEKRLYLAGGQRLDQGFLTSVVLPAGMRALLYRNLQPGFSAEALTGVSGEVAQPERFEPLITEVQRDRQDVQRVIEGNDYPGATEAFEGIALNGRDGELIGVLLIGSPRTSLAALLNSVRSLALVAFGAVILLTLVLGWWISSRITGPARRLTKAANQLAAGNWEAPVQVRARGEVGRLAAAFNRMTESLKEQRERLLQAERVTAWRDVARRLAQQVKEPLFPLQLSVENLRRAREQTSEQFDEVFFESTATLRAELENLKAVVGRFSDFAKMAEPDFQPVDLNESIRGIVKQFEPQFSAVGRPPIEQELYLDEQIARVHADPAMLRSALEHLVLHAVQAMAAGGTLTVRTSQNNGVVRLELSDTGQGFSPEERDHLFAPGESGAENTAGLGLAIVQSVVSDHHGRISVDTAPGAGATFRIELPVDSEPAPDARPGPAGPLSGILT